MPSIFTAGYGNYFPPPQNALCADIHKAEKNIVSHEHVGTVILFTHVYPLCLHSISNCKSPACLHRACRCRPCDRAACRQRCSCAPCHARDRSGWKASQSTSTLSSTSEPPSSLSFSTLRADLNGGGLFFDLEPLLLRGETNRHRHALVDGGFNCGHGLIRSQSTKLCSIHPATRRACWTDSSRCCRPKETSVSVPLT